MIEPASRPEAPHAPPPAPTGLTDARLALLVAAGLFVLSAWPLLLVALPPLQDLPNHIATAHIIAHPERYPEFAFNGFFKSNALLTLWLSLAGDAHLFAAARAFTALALATNALGLPLVVLRFAGRRYLLTAMLFLWPLVHGFFVSMGMLNFAFAVGLALLLATLVDRQRERPTLARAFGIAAVAGLSWYAHPFPLAVVGVLCAAHVATRSNGRARIAAGVALLAPLAPAGVLALVSAAQHLLKAPPATGAAAATFAYAWPWETVANLWLGASGALTRWGSMTLLPALLLPCFAWRGRRERRAPRAIFTGAAAVGLLVAYAACPVMISNWWYFNARLVPFVWVGLALQLPARVPRPVAALLAAAALSFSIVLGVDYVRLDRDRAQFTAGLAAVPRGATLLPLMFAQRQTSDFTASLTHAWAYYTIQRDTAAPLVFAVERSYPITYRTFPPAALIPPALDQFAENNRTPDELCRHVSRAQAGAGCAEVWRARWAAFWSVAEPRFDHVLAWAMPSEARAVVPARYHRVFAAGALEIFAR